MNPSASTTYPLPSPAVEPLMAGPAIGRAAAARGVAAAAIAAFTLGGWAEASSAATAKTMVPADRERLVLSRFSTGINPRVMAQYKRAGSALGWLNEQFSTQLPDDDADGLLGWFPLLSRSPQSLWNSFVAGTVTPSDVTQDFARWTILRRITSTNSVREVMADFWSNLLHVPNPLDKVWPHRFGYDQTIRMNSLGTFSELLQAAILHPAMLCYLDQYTSTKQEMNENLGRELLELHTVGLNYSEDDVTGSARILTGYLVDRAGTWAASYDPSAHYVGPVQVLNFTSANRSPNGQQVTLDYLDYLANHPATAARLARRLATRFVSETPSQALVSAVAAAYLKSGTDIPATLRALVAHPDFGAGGLKVRTPLEDYVASCRALRLQVTRPKGSQDFANLCLYQADETGQQPFDWPRPDGFPDLNQAWGSSSRMLGSWKAHHALARSYRPATGVSYEPAVDWFPPKLGIRFDTLVAHVCRRLLIDDLDAGTLRAASIAVNTAPNEVMTTKHPFVKYNRMPLLLACLLDSPQHMNR